jgi:hypothetical protein
VASAAAVVAVAVLAATAATGCSPTTYDDSVATTAAPVSSTTLPAGTAADLLPVMLEEVALLSTRVINSDGDGAAADRIEQIWAAVVDEVGASRPELLADFEFVVSRCRLAADRNRPADADRAYKNLTVLVGAYLG